MMRTLQIHHVEQRPTEKRLCLFLFLFSPVHLVWRERGRARERVRFEWEVLYVKAFPSSPEFSNPSHEVG